MNARKRMLVGKIRQHATAVARFAQALEASEYPSPPTIAIPPSERLAFAEQLHACGVLTDVDLDLVRHDVAGFVRCEDCRGSGWRRPT